MQVSTSPPPKKYDCHWRRDLTVQADGMSVEDLKQLIACSEENGSPAQASIDKIIEKEERENTPINQRKLPSRYRWPAWLKELPLPHIPTTPNPNFHLISEARLLQAIELTDNQEFQEQLCRRLTRDAAVLEVRLMPHFRERDHEAKLYQNRYRSYQIGFVLLAALATLLGGLQALELYHYRYVAAVVAFLETLVTLASIYLVTLNGREPILKNWLSSRRCAEQLRREYFRYLLRLPPYHNLRSSASQELIGIRTSAIFLGSNPEEPSQLPAEPSKGGHG